MGPAVIVTLGVLFLLGEMRGGYFGFNNTYPVILIVIGFISIGASLAPMTGHVSPTAPQVPPPGVYQAPPAAPPRGTPPQSFSGQGQ
jgi:hypothetical protein